MTPYQHLFLDESKVPFLYGQKVEKGDDIVVHSVIHAPVLQDWFWCVTEKDPETGLCFGFVNGDFAEFGYFDLDEMLESGVEFKMHPKWTPGMTMGDVREAFKEEMHEA